MRGDKRVKQPAAGRVWLPMVAAVVLLGGMALAAWQRPRPADAAGYHAKIRQMAKSIPKQVADWVGTKEPVPRSAIALLHPNVLRSIRYQNTATGQTVSFVLVQCKDARDMAGHYPPICYPANGWTKTAAHAETWNVKGLRIPGETYHFSYERPDGIQRITVMDFMVLPSGKIVRSIQGVYDAAADYSEHFFGAAQIQVVFYRPMTEAARRRIFRQLVGPNVKLIKAIESGVAMTEGGKSQ